MQNCNTIELTAPRKLRACINLPASKSISNRALVINALSHSNVLPENVSDCDDTQVMIAALRDMPEVIDIGAAGTAMRFLTAYLCVTSGQHVITGTERMRHRPIGILVDALRQLGADVQYEGEEGFPPLRIVGRDDLKGGTVEMAADVSSQFLSALLMIGPTLKDGLVLKLKGRIASRPYLEMTIKMMRTFGAEVEWESADTIRVSHGNYKPTPYVIENDWSAASYWYEMVALSNDPEAKILLPGLEVESLQGDRMVSGIFYELGVETQFIRGENGKSVLRLTKNNEYSLHFECGFLHIPDLAQTTVVTAALLNTPFSVFGLESLRIKETDRIGALQTELRKLGYLLNATDAQLEWDGVSRVKGPLCPEIATYEDHRMAMAFAPACLCIPRIRIQHPEVVSKSYPTFWDDMKKAGFEICS